MADAEEALTTATTISSDSTVDFVIDKDLRVIAVPSRGVVLGVEGDKDVNTIRFTMPKEYKGIDLTRYFCRVSWRNANGDVGVYQVPDLQQDDGDESQLEFTWLLAEGVTRYKGTVQFAVGFRKLDGVNVVKAYNTTIGTATSLVGLESPTSQDSSTYDDLLALIDDKTAYADAAGKLANEEAANAQAATEDAKSATAAAINATDSGSLAAKNATDAAVAANNAAKNATDAAATASNAASAITALAAGKSVIHFATRSDGKTGPVLTVFQED